MSAASAPPPPAAAAPPLPLPGHTLATGTRLLDYQVLSLLGEGGFGIVYLALDLALERRVALKEYLPASMASRGADTRTVRVKSPRQQEAFDLGLKSFVNEARLLARFDHPALVKVHRFWEENGTAYMVMPFYEGPTLKDALAALGRKPSEDELRQWLMPLLDALQVLHAERCLHRDIAPDNILLTASGPLLLDFGAARRVIGDMTHALTVVLKPGFAPIEQYGEIPGMTQGPWTDLYALAAVVYTAVTGRKPVSSVERVVDDRLRSLAEIAAGEYSAPFLHTIDRALALLPDRRPPSVAAFRALLDGIEPGDAAAAEKTVTPWALRGAAQPQWAAQPQQPILDRPVSEALAPPWSSPPTPPAEAPAPAQPVPPAVDRRRWPLWVVGLAGAGVALAAVLLLATRPAPPAAPALAEPDAPTPAATAPPPAQAEPPAQAAQSTPAIHPAALEPMPQAAPASPPGAAPPSASGGAGPPPLDAPAAAAPVVPSAPAQVAPATVEPKAPVERVAPPQRPAPRPAPRDTPRPAPAQTTPPRAAEVDARCSAILQKGSLEPLSVAETDFLKRECR